MTELAATTEPAGKMRVVAGGEAESAAIEPELAIVIDAWLVLSPRSRSTIVGLARKAVAKRGKQDSMPSSAK